MGVLATLSLLLAGCGSGAGGSDGGLRSIRVGYPSDTASYGDLYACQDQGIFEKHGLKVELTLLKTSSQLLAGLTSGSVQVAGGDGTAIAAGALGGTDVKMVELKIPVYFTELWAGPEVRSLADLAGKKVGVTAPGSVTDKSTRTMLADQGLDKDVQVVNLNSLPALLSAGQNGAVDALVTAPPQGATTQAFGWHKVTDTTKYPTAASVYTVTGSYAAENRDVVSDFVAADVECLQFVKNPANRDATVASIAKYTKTDDRALAEYGYDFFSKVWTTEPVVDEKLVRQTMQDVAGSNPVPDDISPFIDNSFVEAALAGTSGAGR
ncbi:ABC transporter substrate-binding protein [Pseudonocardia endophytica]|uniref:NitT/TauT family transport system substrate-binding protein n=1 Tax=Pseudonocardia endophytica TaxID=401976 RepID=A0A4R1HL64_PSEEN|nr:ABC transporter substrate-binding protein [Pseudonocardia endophytica]TCK21831.1 NitT/TauT family transport system substrate-binding protein [Pseudonocardia endophytica]